MQYCPDSLVDTHTVNGTLNHNHNMSQPKNPEEALKSFTYQFINIIYPAMKKNRKIEWVKKLIENPLVSSAKTTSSKDCIDQVKKSLGSNTKESFIYGSLEALESKEIYWSVIFDTGLSGALGGFMDVLTGEIICIYLIPEG